MNKPLVEVKVYLPARLLRMRGDKPSGAQGHNQIMNQIHELAALKIKHEFLPRKFSAELFTRYAAVAQRRRQKYENWKVSLLRRGLIQTTRPNVLSGNLRRAATIDARVTSTATRGRVYFKTSDGMKVSGPRMGQRYFRKLPERHRRELEYLADQDIRELAAYCRQLYVNAANDPSNAVTQLRRPIPNTAYIRG